MLQRRSLATISVMQRRGRVPSRRMPPCHPPKQHSCHSTSSGLVPRSSRRVGPACGSHKPTCTRPVSLMRPRAALAQTSRVLIPPCPPDPDHLASACPWRGSSLQEAGALAHSHPSCSYPPLTPLEGAPAAHLGRHGLIVPSQGRELPTQLGKLR